MEKYQSIIEFVEEQISSGKMLPKSKLPSVGKLAEYFQCSAGTVVKAYTELLNKHMIYTTDMPSWNSYFCKDPLPFFFAANPKFWIS